MPEENESNSRSQTAGVPPRRHAREQSVEAESVNPVEEILLSPATEAASEPEPDEPPPPPEQPTKKKAQTAGECCLVSRRRRKKKRTAGANAEKERKVCLRGRGRSETAYNQTNRGKPSRLPEGPFLSLVNMLAFEAAIHLGLMQAPGGSEMTVDLESARPMIDMLGTLQEKTRGNLSVEEDTLLDNVLADLRMQFVALSRRR